MTQQIESDVLELTIDLATLYLVRQILEQERQEEVSVKEVSAAVKKALKEIRL